MIRLSRTYLFGFIIFGLISSISQNLFAHTRSVSYSNWLITESEIIMTFTVPAREVTKLDEYKLLYPDLNASLQKHLSNSIVPTPELELVESKPVRTEQGTVGTEHTYRLENINLLNIRIDSFFPIAPGHTHYATIKDEKMSHRTVIINQKNKSINLISNQTEIANQGFKEMFSDYINLGFFHILSGLDHLVFLLVLLLLCTSLKQLVLAATGFTIGHSVTLFLAASNLIIPKMQVIESLIGLTIVIASIEAIRLPNRELKRLRELIIVFIGFALILSIFTSFLSNTLLIIGIALLVISVLTLMEDEDTSTRYRPALAAIFGTIHGFGFANVLSEIEIIKSNFLIALFGFNIGVELGQILVLAFLWPAFLLISKEPNQNHFIEIRSVLSSILLAIGLYWFITRSFI